VLVALQAGEHEIVLPVLAGHVSGGPPVAILDAIGRRLRVARDQVGRQGLGQSRPALGLLFVPIVEVGFFLGVALVNQAPERYAEQHCARHVKADAPIDVIVSGLGSIGHGLGLIFDPLLALERA
jgi:hypothetical protein